MASVFKRKRKVKLANGKTVVRQSQKYYTRLTDAEGIKRTIPLFRDKTASQQRATQLQKEIEMARVGVVDRFKEHRKRPLAEHLEDFHQALLAKGNTAKYAAQTIQRVKNVFVGCKFVYWNDISASTVQRCIATLRDDDTICASTSNHYLQRIKQFAKWMVLDGRADQSPVEHLQPINSSSDKRHQRRALEPDEIRRLLEVTRAAKRRYGMDGHERALLYKLAVETGLRANELRSLKKSSFDFDGLSVMVMSGYTKNRKETTQWLKLDTAAELKEFFKGKMSEVKAFGGTYKKLTTKTAEMLKADLADAGIDYQDEAGRYFDFHALRGETGTLLAASGVHPKVAQSIMRHSNINLTMSLYTHTLRGQESEAIAGLPDLSLPSSKAQKAVATGTDNRPVDVVQNDPKELTRKLTPKLTPTAYSGCNRPAPVGKKQSDFKENSDDDNCLQDGKLSTESKRLSMAVIDKNTSLSQVLQTVGKGCSIR